jgi:type IV secretion system protein VirB10
MTGTDPNPAAENPARPLVATSRRSSAPLIFGIGLAVTATGLFSALEARRANLSSPAISVPSGTTGASIAPPPALAIPQDYGSYAVDQGALRTQPDALSDAMIASLRGVAGEGAMAANSPRSYRGPPYQPNVTYSEPASFQSAPATPSVLMRPQAAPTYEAAADPDRAVATRFANPGSTVPKGTVIHAVLETAFDSTRAGFARAIISRDVRSFDGVRVLVPKGSKLLGEYQADLNHGQNRALVQWHRLMLPDGVMIDVDSPSTDSLGRAGVKGKVNSHFLARFGGSILQSVLDIGVQVATRKAAGDTLILGVPIGSQEKIAPQGDVKPTLTIKQGSSVAVLVARDLDFTSVLP